MGQIYVKKDGERPDTWYFLAAETVGRRTAYYIRQR